MMNKEQKKNYIEEIRGFVEKNDSTGSYGKSQHFTKIHIDKELPKGLIVNCKIYKIKENILQAKLI